MFLHPWTEKAATIGASPFGFSYARACCRPRFGFLELFGGAAAASVQQGAATCSESPRECKPGQKMPRSSQAGRRHAAPLESGMPLDASSGSSRPRQREFRDARWQWKSYDKGQPLMLRRALFELIPTRQAGLFAGKTKQGTGAGPHSLFIIQGNSSKQRRAKVASTKRAGILDSYKPIGPPRLLPCNVCTPFIE